MKARVIKGLSPTTRMWVMALAAASIVLVAFLQPKVSYAQDGNAGALLEEIVTVARKRSQAEAVQDVPIAVTAFGADQLDALFVKKLEDLSYTMPNVQLESVGTFPGVQNFSIRGQGINSSIPSVDPTVGVFVDGIYMGTTYGVVIDTFDLESVEVLRGPQGLLFGRNVTGGAVVLRNARPTGEFGARVRVGLTDDDQGNVAAAIEGSIIEDTLAWKLVGYYDEDPGYFNNINQSAASLPAPHPFQPFYLNPAIEDGKVGGMLTRFARGTLVWTPSDTVDWTMIAEHGGSNGDGASWTNVTEQRLGVRPNFTTLSDENGATKINWTSVMLEVNVGEVGNGTLTNILGWRRVDSFSVADIDGTNNPIFAAPGNADQHQLSNELRWSGNISDNWETTAGIYYFDQDVVYREARYIWLPPPIGPAPFGINLQAALGGDMDSRNVGVFWNNDFHLNDAWTVTAGIRYTDEKKGAQIIIGGCADNVTFNCLTDNLSGDWQNFTPKLGLRWQINDSAQAYAFWSQGYRSGGFNFRNARPDVIPPGPTKEEQNNTFEVGVKSDLMDGRMRLNIAAFHNEITDMQRELNMPDSQVIVLQATVNAGDVTITGVEADIVAMLGDNFSINLSAGFQDGKYDKKDPFVLALTDLLRGIGAIGPTANVIGDELPRLAPSNYSAGFSWDIPLSSSLINVMANYSWREKHPYDDANSQFFDDQERINASVNWYSGNDKWSASLYGKNLTDEANWGNLTSIAGLYVAGPMKKGRVLGLEINYRY